VIRDTIESARLLVVSRDSAIPRMLWSMGVSNYWLLESAPDAWEAMEHVQSGVTPDLMLLDLPQEDVDSLHILRWLRRLRPALPIILIGHPDDPYRKQEALRLGAQDYMVRPLNDGQLEMAIRRLLSAVNDAAETDITSDDVELISDENFFIGISPIMRKLRVQAGLLAEANVPVLILGESGSGKETIARLVHKLSVRSGFEFAKVNCAALPSDLLERELFGAERDATGSARAKLGKLELCAEGTILLDEITEMPIGVQTNLLKVLQTKQFVRPGTSTSIDVDARVLATSTTNMEHAISESRLSEDLYYHLSAYTIHVPPLRQRRNELPFLSRHLMHQLAKRYSLAPRDFSPAILEACQAYSWPGNLRELENFVKRYLMVGDRGIAFEKSRSRVHQGMRESALNSSRVLNQLTPSVIQFPTEGAGSESLKSQVQSVKLEAEKNAIRAALVRTGWNRRAAARLLKISHRTLVYKIEQYQMKSMDPSLSQESDGFRMKGVGFRDDGRMNELD